MLTNHSKLFQLVFCAAIAAVYLVLTVALGAISYGVVQFRISELLSLLPYFFPYTAWGVTLGCFLANLFSPVGIADIIFGTLATAVSCAAVAAIGKKDSSESDSVNNQKKSGLLSDSRIGWKVAASFIPVIVNGVIVGAMLALTGAGSLQAALPIFAVQAASVAAGEAVVTVVLGLPMLIWLPKTGFLRNFIKK